MTYTRPVSVRISLLILLSLIGFGISAYLSQHYYELHAGPSSFKSFCVLGDTMNCDAVAASRFAETVPGLPISNFSAGWFLSVLITALFLLSAEWRREASRFLLLLSGAGVVSTLFYLAVMIWVLKTYCVLCLGIDAAVVASFITVLTLKPQSPKTSPLNTSQWKTFFGISATAIIITVILLKGTLEKSPEADDFTLRQMVDQVLGQAPVAVQSGEEFASIGPKDALITVVEFSDFQCPHCKKGALLIHSLISQYPGKVRLVHRNYPLDPSCNSNIQQTGHPFACEAAKTSLCAHQQGKFDLVYQDLFEHQESLDPGKIREFAVSRGVAGDRLAGCVAAPETHSAIIRDIEEGRQLGVKATPTFFINGRKMEGAYPLAAWRMIFERILAASP